MRYVEPFLGSGAIFLSMLPGSPLPFLRWAGGKRKLVGEVRQRLGLSAAGITDYLVADVNPDLVAAWRAVRDDVEKVQLFFAVTPASPEEYAAVRSLSVSNGSDADDSAFLSLRGARAIYLNQYAHAGLWRTNRKNEYNVPPDPARFASVDINAVAAHLRLISSRLSKTEIRCQDFRSTLADCGGGDLIYVDPPYLPGDAASEFTSYAASGFSKQDTMELAALCAFAVVRGARVVVSNSLTAMPIFANAALASGIHFQGDTVQARRSIGVGKGRAETPRQVGEMMATMWKG